MNIHRVSLAEAFEVVRGAPEGLSNRKLDAASRSTDPTGFKKRRVNRHSFASFASSFVFSRLSCGSPLGWPSSPNGANPARGWPRSAMRSWASS